MRVSLFLTLLVFLIGCGMDKRYYDLSDPMKQEYSYIYYLASKSELDGFFSLPAGSQEGWLKQFWMKRTQYQLPMRMNSSLR